MMSARTRPPSGRNNRSQASQQQSSRSNNAFKTSPRPSSASSALQSKELPPSPLHSARKSSRGSSARSNAGSSRGIASSARSRNSGDCYLKLFSDRSDVNTREILTRLRNKHADEERRKAAEETLLMSSYNPFSRPRPSSSQPLRTAFLDPEANNFFPSRTRTELMKRIKMSALPHPSYDIDGDGWVSQEDYKLAKRFDFDGNGVIDPYERKIAKGVITDEFFKAHKENLHVFGDKIANASHEENVTAVVNSKNFERTFGLLKGVEESLKGRSSKEILSCMDADRKNLTKHNFYTNKFDTTAWNDYDAVPRGDTRHRDLQHHGSRRRLLESRKAKARMEGDYYQDKATAGERSFRNHRISLISNVALEN